MTEPRHSRDASTPAEHRAHRARARCRRWRGRTTSNVIALRARADTRVAGGASARPPSTLAKAYQPTGRTFPAPARDRAHHLLRRAVIAAFAAGTLWYLFTVPWGIAVHQLVMFTAPGALLGLAFAWASSSFEPFRYTWSRARRAAINGAVFLPPLLAFLVVLAGNTRPQRLLVGVVYGAWTALLGGMALAVLRPERAMLTTGRRALSGSVVRHSEQP